MKLKFTVAAIIAVTTLGLTSCQKSYNCECRNKSTNGVDFSSEFEAENRSKADVLCDGFDNSSRECALH